MICPFCNRRCEPSHVKGYWDCKNHENIEITIVPKISNKNEMNYATMRVDGFECSLFPDSEGREFAIGIFKDKRKICYYNCSKNDFILENYSKKLQTILLFL